MNTAMNKFMEMYISARRSMDELDKIDDLHWFCSAILADIDVWSSNRGLDRDDVFARITEMHKTDALNHMKVQIDEDTLA